jgi:hypothetical protein
MKAQLSFLMKGIFLILVILIIFVVFYIITNYNYGLSVETKKLELKESSLNILDKLISRQCLGYEVANTTSKTIDLNKLLEFTNKYQDSEPECARDTTFDYRIKVEKFGSNITFYGGSFAYVVCFTIAPCASAQTYLASKPYKTSLKTWLEIANNNIKDCDAILIENDIANAPSTLHQAIKDNLLKFVEEGKLLVTTSFGLPTLEFLFPSYVKSCKEEVCSDYRHPDCKKCIQLTEEGRKELIDIQNPFWASFLEGDYLFEILSPEVKVLVNFSKAPCQGGDVFTPPATCSNAAMIMFNYGKGIVIHQVMILGGLTGDQEYNKVNLFTKILERYGGLGKTVLNVFEDRPEIWEFGVKNFSKKDAFRAEVTFSLPITIRIKDNQIQPGRITIKMVDGELEELVGVLDDVCISNITKELRLSLSYPVEEKNGYVCMRIEKEDICKKTYCKVNHFSINQGSYTLSIKKVGDSIDVKY